MPTLTAPSTLTGTVSHGQPPVPTLRQILQGQLDTTVPQPAQNLVNFSATISIAALVTALADLGLEPDRVFISPDTDAEMQAPTFAGRLKLLRNRANLSQESLAKKITVPTGTVTQWETGRRTPNLKMAVRIAKALGVDLNAFADCDWGDEEGESEN